MWWAGLLIIFGNWKYPVLAWNYYTTKSPRYLCGTNLLQFRELYYFILFYNFVAWEWLYSSQLFWITYWNSSSPISKNSWSGSCVNSAFVRSYFFLLSFNSASLSIVFANSGSSAANRFNFSSDLTSFLHFFFAFWHRIVTAFLIPVFFFLISAAFNIFYTVYCV